MTGARRTPLSNRSGAEFVGVTAPANGADDGASDADALEEQDSRNLARDARAAAQSCWSSVAPIP